MRHHSPPPPSTRNPFGEKHTSLTSPDGSGSNLGARFNPRKTITRQKTWGGSDPIGDEKNVKGSSNGSAKQDSSSMNGHRNGNNVLPVISVAKTINQLLHDPSNRCCADCRSALVDSSQIHASFRPSMSALTNAKTASRQSMGLARSDDFASRHRAFAPPAGRGTRRNSSGNLDVLRPKRTIDDGSDSNLVFGITNTDLDRHTHHVRTETKDITAHNSYNSAETTPHNPPNGSYNSHHPNNRESEDPAILALRYTLGHGVFLCAQCAHAHQLMGEKVTTVRHIQQYQSWTPEEALLMKQAGGNTMGWKVYEAFLPETWRRRRPNHASQMGDRLIFCRAKYEALSFILPSIVGGPWCEHAWQCIMARNEWAQEPHNRAQAAELQNILSLFLNQRSWPRNGLPYDKNNKNAMKGAMAAAAAPLKEPPQRLVDYFCVVGSSGFLDPRVMHREQVDLSTLGGPEDVMLEPRVMDCYPPPKQHTDMEFPEHVATFVLPEGCCPSDSQKSPFFFTFVLTEASGHRLYGASLRLYDEAIETHELRDIMEKSGYIGSYPSWLPHQQTHTQDGNRSVASSSNTSSDYNDIVYLPKCLVVLSHYPFFDLFRNFLLQLYRITLVEAPLPIERFIANFCCELPLPPQGKVEVKFGFTVKDLWSIKRPPENRLPLANFSYKPLFACLSVGNIIALMGCLMMESRVALCSRHYALFGPISEALLSFLFPIHWQGMYIPIMPYAMLDILDAPVPFLVGVHARYLIETKPEMRPQGVVFVDLDRDIIHLGCDEDSNYPRMLPALPEKGALKLRAKLEEHGSLVYLVPDNAKHEGKTITHGHGQVLPDSKRESYAAASVPFFGAASDRASTAGSEEFRREERPTLRRRNVLRAVDKAYQENELLTPITGFLSEQGQLYDREPVRHLKTQKSGTMGKLFNIRRLRSTSHASLQDDELGHSSNPTNQPQPEGAHGALLDLEEPPGFNSNEIRNAFLRFFVSLLKGYEQFINIDNPNRIFRVDDFLADLSLPINNSEFVKRVVTTQMFHHFLEERQNDLPVYQFFDEQIIAKQNRSMRLGVRQKDTPFLDDPSGAIKETFTPPPPSNWGLPDDGRSYQYGCFPKLDDDLFGKVRTPIQWPKSRKSHSLRNLRKHVASPSSRPKAWQHEIMAWSISPALPKPGAFYWAAKKGIENLETAIVALSHSSYEDKPPVFRENLSTSRRKASLEHLSRTLSPRGNDKQLRRAAFEKGFSATTLASAENVVINARRVKGVMLLEFCKVQSVARMFLARKRYLLFLKALRFLQYKWRRHIPEGLTEMDELERARISAVRLQGVARSYMMLRNYRRKKAAIALLQRWFRGAVCRARLKNLQRACKRIQRRVQSRRAQFGLQLLRNLVAKVQARIRGFLTRHRMTSLNESRMSRYREQIFLLWHRSHTPLSYRTKFWPIVSDKCGHLRLRIAESELERLWIVLEVDFNSGSFARSHMDHKHAEELRLGKLLDITDHTYWRYLKVHEMIGSVLLFPAEERRNTELRLAADRVEAERIQIYERVSASSPVIAAMLITLYGLFKIDKKDKHKKYRLAELAWTDPKRANQSEMLMVHVFPELEEASNIIFNPPTKKTLKRFRNVNPSPPRLGKSHWAHSILKNQISRNVREVAINSLQGAHLPSSLLCRGKSAVEVYMERQSVLRKDSKEKKFSWMEIRRELIDSLLVNRTWEGK